MDRAALRADARAIPASGIVELFNYGRGRPGLIPLWVGEGDEATEGFICDAVAQSLQDGETFYSAQRGQPELRDAIAAYMNEHYGGVDGASATPFDAARFSVTTGGMHALMIALRMIAGPGDDIVILAPAWPNFLGATSLTRASVVEVALRFEPAGDAFAWRLDMDDLSRAITPRTRAIIVNTPANPTGWTASREELQAILDLARSHGLWIVADEIYGRLVYEGERAASFHDVMAVDDRIVFVQTFSKNWAMTGLRVGWLEAPAGCGETIENLIQYSTTGVPMPIQRGALAGLKQGDRIVERLRKRMSVNRTVLTERLAATGRARFAPPQGAFYLFCAIDGETDTRALAFRLVDEANVGVAPGSAFGPHGAGFLRLCLARRSDELAIAAKRLAYWLDQRRKAH